MQDERTERTEGGGDVSFLLYAIHGDSDVATLSSSTNQGANPEDSLLMDNQFPLLLAASRRVGNWAVERIRECGSHPYPVTRDPKDGEHEEKDVCGGGEGVAEREEEE